MFGGRERVIATAIIWAALALIMIFADVDFGNFISLAVLLGVAGWATAEVWNTKHDASQPANLEASEAHSEKAKRKENQRLSRLVDSLSEEDIATLEAVLAARREQFDEDEQIELNRLLADQERTRR
jgi:hypothetical protein